MHFQTFHNLTKSHTYRSFKKHAAFANACMFYTFHLHQGMCCHIMPQSRSLDSAALSGVLSKWSSEKWRTLQKSLYSILCKTDLSNWQCYGAAWVPSETILQKRPRTIDIREVSEKVECFQVSKRTSVWQQHLFCCPKQNRSSKCFSLSYRMSIVLDLFCRQISLRTHAAPY